MELVKWKKQRVEGELDRRTYFFQQGEELQAEAERQQAEAERQQAEAARRTNERLRKLLIEAGLDPGAESRNCTSTLGRLERKLEEQKPDELLHEQDEQLPERAGAGHGPVDSQPTLPVSHGGGPMQKE